SRGPEEPRPCGRRPPHLVRRRWRVDGGVMTLGATTRRLLHAEVPSAGLAMSAQRLLGAARSAPVAAADPMTLQRFLSLPVDDRPMFAVADGMGVDSLAMLIGLWRLGL